jgi:hypothetical protein
LNDDPDKAESCDLSLRDAWSVLLAWLRRLLENWFWEPVPKATRASEPTSWADSIRPPATRLATVLNERRHHRAERRAAPPTSPPPVSRMCEDCKKVRDDVKGSRFMVALCDECYIARAFGHELHPPPRPSIAEGQTKKPAIAEGQTKKPVPKTLPAQETTPHLQQEVLNLRVEMLGLRQRVESLERDQRRTKIRPSTPVTSSATMKGCRLYLQPDEIRTALLASLEVEPCAVCACDLAAGISAERAESDPAHCDSCDLNWPTRIGIGNGVLETRQRGQQTEAS